MPETLRVGPPRRETKDARMRRQAERALRRFKQRFDAFMDHTPAIAWIKDRHLRYTYVSEPFLRQLGMKREQVLGRTVLEIWPGSVGSQRMLEADRRVQREQRPVQVIDSDMPRPDGSNAHWLVSKFPLADETGAIGVGGVSLDISERVEAEKEARMLLDRLISTQESERKRLATGLHDLIGQNLTALGIWLANLEGRLDERSRACIGGEVGSMRRTVEQTIESIRGVMSELRPEGLDDYGLVAALRAYGADFQVRTALRTTVDARDAVPRLPGRTEAALFRIAQEALTNAAKHSGATCVNVLIEPIDGGVRLEVCDDGRGFAQPQGARRRHGGWGLRAMRERAEACGGRLRIEHPARGARVVAEVPLPVERHAD